MFLTAAIHIYTTQAKFTYTYTYTITKRSKWLMRTLEEHLYQKPSKLTVYNQCYIRYNAICMQIKCIDTQNYPENLEVPRMVNMITKQCPVCNEYLADSPHHLRPRAEGGTDDNRNRVYLCHRCHDIVEDIYNTTSIEYNPWLVEMIKMKFGFAATTNKLLHICKPRIRQKEYDTKYWVHILEVAQEHYERVKASIKEKKKEQRMIRSKEHRRVSLERQRISRERDRAVWEAYKTRERLRVMGYSREQAIEKQQSQLNITYQFNAMRTRLVGLKDRSITHVQVAKS